MLFTASRRLFCILSELRYEKSTPKILTVSVVKLTNFKPQTVSKILFREPSPAISHLLKFAFSHEEIENTFKVFIRFSTDNKTLRKNVESPAKAMYKKVCLTIVIRLIIAYLFINSKRTSKVSQWRSWVKIWAGAFSGVLGTYIGVN